MSGKSASSSRNTLQRGMACIRCRRRKMRCDSARPVCTPCIQANRVEDCEYTDNQGRTRTQLLEDNIARLESRLQELEGNADSGQPLLLHDPYAASASTANRDVSPREPFVGGTSSRNVSPRSDIASDLPTQISEFFYKPLCLHSPPLRVSIFLPHSRILGFALDPSRFRGQQSLPALHPDRPHAALLGAVHLWGIRKSNSIELRQREDMYLQRSILALQDSSEVSHEAHNAARRRVQAVQAEVLLAQYFFCLGLNLEGRYHVNAAVTLALSCGLHRNATSVDHTHAAARSSVSASLNASLGLPPPRDTIERAERIRMFWAVYDLDSRWSATLESPRLLSDDAARGTQINVPWSDESQADYSDRTVQMFLSGQAVVGDNESCFVLRTKASALLQRAVGLAAQVETGVSVEAEVQLLGRITTQFARSLPQLDQIDALASEVRQVLAVTHAVSHAAMVYLHRALGRAFDASLSHANEILAILEYVSRHNSDENATQDDQVVLDPMLAMVGSVSGCALVKQLDRARRGPRTHESLSQQRTLRVSIDRLINVLQACAGLESTYPIFSQYAERIRDDLSVSPE